MKKYTIVILLNFVFSQTINTNFRISITEEKQLGTHQILLNKNQESFRFAPNSIPVINDQELLAHISFPLASNAVFNGILPEKYTCGNTLSPDINWNNFAGDNQIKSYVLFLIGNYDKLDHGFNDQSFQKCNNGIFWMIYNISPSTKAIEEGYKAQGGAIELKPYSGPCHICSITSNFYKFIVYGIDIILDHEKIKNVDDVMTQIIGHIIAKGKMPINLPNKIH